MSALTLALDGSTYSASIALLRDGKLVGESVAGPESGGGGRGEALVPMIAQMLSANGLRADQITEVICGAGPGSFTSLRVAASVGKGIAVAAGAKMYAVSSLLLTVG
ncbi:MAG: tRNA (adenosine(37)-N6)-threonylcarbamoyltransferase complex dimerization subunit type 1 TsaB, partial [Gemmatimonadota bacterium]|nr:tRNA (adenosine(37)-N6)-threonylcarbamoyltransferase complex dimerization subunit type 1 TsaB [Gemmatimonadota bacterium]